MFARFSNFFRIFTGDRMISNPVIVILGSTGSGKTKLSLELAKKFDSEIIGADSMQVYKGLDIITAKATKEEQGIARHHLIDILEPTDVHTVLDFRNQALEIIDNLHVRKKVPIIVGGTNYYIEAILWKILVEDEGHSRKEVPGVLPKDEHELPSVELHTKLQKLDPDMAKRLHPNNKRKILRSLEVLYQKGKMHSEILKEQQRSAGASRTGGPLRYENALIFWLQCNQEILDDRLNKRVDAMIDQGLLGELENFHKLYNEHRIRDDKLADYTKGVFQSIGFKEFHKYLTLPPADRNTDDGQKVFEQGVEDLKTATRRYARKQTRWVSNRFLARNDRQVPPLYGLSTDDVSKFDENVTSPAMEIAASFLGGAPCKYNPLPPKTAQSFPNSDDDTHRCEVCERLFVGEHQWTTHLRSAKHRRLSRRKGDADRPRIVEYSQPVS